MSLLTVMTEQTQDLPSAMSLVQNMNGSKIMLHKTKYQWEASKSSPRVVCCSRYKTGKLAVQVSHTPLKQPETNTVK